MSTSRSIASRIRSWMSARSSPSVSNSLTEVASSSSSAGSTRSFTSFTVTWNVAVFPATLASS